MKNNVIDYLDDFDGHIDMDLLSKFFTDAVNEEFDSDPFISNQLIADIHTVFSTAKSIHHMYAFMMSVGILLNKYKPEGVSDELSSYSPVYGKLRITVPIESELKIRFNEKDEYKPLIKENAARMVKYLIVDIIDKCCLRFPHEPLSKDIITVQFKEVEPGTIPNITLSTFKGLSEKADKATESHGRLANLINNIKNSFPDPGDIDIIMDKLKRLDMLEWYGCHFDVAIERKAILSIHVPKSSSFQAPGTTMPYCGEILYNEAVSTLRELNLLRENDVVDMVIDDVYWDSSKFQLVYNKTNEFSDVIRGILET